MKDNLLEVGDVLYIPKRFGRGYEGKTTVKRVTAKQAEVDSGQKVWREVERNGFVKKVGYNSYGVNSYRLETDETKDLYANQVAENIVKKTLNDFHNGFTLSGKTTAELSQLNEDLLSLISKYSKK